MDERQAKVIRAVGKRISECGDMPIRVHRLTMRTLMRTLGLGSWEVGEDNWREVDALALDALRHLTFQRLGA